MMHYMTDKTALVHQMPFSADRSGFAATLEKVSLSILPIVYKLTDEAKNIYRYILELLNLVFIWQQIL